MDENIKNKLTMPFERALVKERIGPGGKVLSYVAIGEYIGRLNDAFGYKWDYEITDVRFLDEEVIVQVRITTPGGMVKAAIGGAAITKRRDNGKPVSAEVKRIEAQLVNVAAPVTLPTTDAIAAGLRRLLDLLADKPEVGHAALVRCGLKLRVVPRPQNGRRFWLVGILDLGGIAGGGSASGGSGYGLNGCSSLPRTGFARRRATASCSSFVRRRTYTPAASMLRAPKKPSDTAYSTSMIMYGSSPIHISSCLRGIPTHELNVNLSRDPSSLRTTIVMRSVAVIGDQTVARL
jgi:hypothetical protein